MEGLKKLGAKIIEKHGYIVCEANRLVGCEINLDFPSVGATENIMMAAVLCEGVTIIENAASEPEIADLANFLNSMGANIKGAGTDVIKVTGGAQKIKTAEPCGSAVSITFQLNCSVEID